jgi:hypothetical protein
VGKIKDTLKKVYKVLSDFWVWYVTNIPPLLLYIALAWLIMTSFNTFKKETIDISIVIFYLSAVGLTISLSATIFSYAKVVSDDSRPKLVEIGEYFLYSSILLIIAFLLNWILVKIKNCCIPRPGLVTKIVFYILLGSSYAAAGSAIYYIHSGVLKLKDHLMDNIFKISR